MKNGILTLLFLSLLSCMPEEELPMKDMGEISGYFIECYCKPGEFYTLNAAKVSPIHEIIDLSDPVNLDVSIKADSIIKLIPTFSPSFLGNFRHDTKFNQFGLDSLYLSIYTPEKEHITAKPGHTGPHRHLFLFRFQGDKLRHDQLPNLIQSHAELLYI